MKENKFGGKNGKYESFALKANLGAIHVVQCVPSKLTQSIYQLHCKVVYVNDRVKLRVCHSLSFVVMLIFYIVISSCRSVKLQKSELIVIDRLL